VQQTLLEAHRDFGGFLGQHEGELLAWLRRILAHNLFNEARRYGARQRDADRELSLDQVRASVDHSSFLLQRCLASSGPSPSELAQEHESAAQLANALSRLPEDYQTVVLLRVFEELPAEEVAQRMGRSAGAVRMLQMRALTALRQEMEIGQSEA
jgi:RNA polymerase sigma-70 factor (ECF subfamily)